MTFPGDEPVTDPEATPEPEPSVLLEAAGKRASAPSPTMPGTLAIVSRGLDLDVASSRDIRRASIYLGLLSLLAAGPIVATVWAFTAHEGGFGWLTAILSGETPPLRHPVSEAFAFAFPVVLVIGIACFAALTVDAQLLATVLIGDRATGRPNELRPALALVRHRFWRLVRASIVTLVIPRLVVEWLLTRGSPGETETQALLINGLDLLVSVPFAYVATGIVLGGVGARESIRRSWRLARARWRLAFLIAIVNTAVAYIAGFALGAGAGVLDRLGTIFGLGSATGSLQVAILAAIVVFAIISIGSLTMTIAALTVAPQVVAFLGLTGYSLGLDEIAAPDDPFATARVAPLISRPMKITVAINALIALIAVSNQS
jgi:hypothetical protein